MTDKNLFSAIGNIDEKYIEEAADEERTRPRLLIFRYGAAAAAFLLVLAASIMVFTNPSTKGTPGTDADFLGLSTTSDSNIEPNDSTNIDSELMLEDENTEGTKPAGVNSDAPNNCTDTESKNAEPQTIPSTRPGGTRVEKYSMVQLNFENERFYRYLSSNDLSELNIKPINKGSLGERIAVLSPENTTRDSLAGCEVFRHKQIDCDAIIILKNGDELVPFIFLGFRYNDRDFSEILSLYGVESSEDIEKITTRPGKPGMAKEKNITDSSEIKAVYDILLSIRNDKGKNDEIKKEYHYDEEKTYIYFKLHLKNGLTYQSFYRVYNGKSYIERHDFLTDEQTETLKNILLKQ